MTSSFINTKIRAILKHTVSIKTNIIEMTFNSLYFSFSKKMEKHSITIMRIALAIVYIWFGALKILGMSPAGELVEETVYWFRPDIFIPILGICETLIGIGLLIKRFIPYSILLLLLHMCATLFPVFILQKICFDAFPYCPTLIGQYIIKNIVLIAGALVVAGKYSTENSLNNTKKSKN